MPPTFAVVLNSSFPYGFNDGPVWAGRGVTVVGSGGIAASRSRLSTQVAPTAFVAQNASFRLASVGGAPTFRHWASGIIDLPQRFGDHPYGRFDPGETWVRWDTKRVAVGFSSQAQIWGPAIEQPIILGNNAGGFPHLLAGTGAPAKIGFFHVHGKIVWGRVDQSAYGTDTIAQHFVTGAAGSIRFDKPQGLEIGATRFIHSEWGSGSIGDVPWTRTFDVLLHQKPPITEDNLGGDIPDNQLASAFFRWIFPTPGLEIYGEFGREDSSGDLRDFMGEPDHDAAYLMGFQKGWTNEDRSRISVFRAEILNSRLSHLRGQSPFYVHTYLLQGHTTRGQVLGAPAGFGGGAMTLAFDRYDRNGRTTIRFDRMMVAEDQLPSELPNSPLADVSYGLRLERARFTRRGMLTQTFGLIHELNRHFTHDAWNINVSSSFSAFRSGARN